MLTDYHVHLRPDEPGTTADKYFTAANADRFKLVAEERGVGELGVSEHIYRFSAALDVWQHDLWKGSAVDDLDAYVEFLGEQGLRRGIEADFIPGREDRIASLLEARDFDYVIGSVHFLATWRSTTSAGTSGITPAPTPTRSGAATSKRWRVRALRALRHPRAP